MGCVHMHPPSSQSMRQPAARLQLMPFCLRAQAMQRIAAASNLIRDLIGPFCPTLATALLERGVDLGREVLPAIMHALAAGPGPATPSQGVLPTLPPHSVTAKCCCSE